MKKLSIALFAVLFLAVAFLYFLHFTGKKDKKSTRNISQTEIKSEGIAFINIDTVIYNFDMFFDRRADLMEKQKKAEAEYTSKENQLKRSAADAQEKVNKGLVTRAQAAEMEQALYQQQQELAALSQNLQNNLMEEEQVMNRQIVDYITTYLEENKSQYNYQYILGRSFGSVVLYGDTGLDITQKVLDALNQKYQTEKK
ncbi:MAG: OmpH family outer membrane protein [Bacteroidales bacterium]|jgi:outer membrane protein|nr:OmpH family outer membrane protein [Bacteroidales bacterium]